MPDPLDLIVDKLSESEPWWFKEARCRDYSKKVFFPNRNQDKKIKAAKAICRRCPVRLECLEFAIETKAEFGIFGGTTPEERSLFGTILSSSNALRGTSQISYEHTLLLSGHTEDSSSDQSTQDNTKFVLHPPSSKFLLEATPLVVAAQQNSFVLRIPNRPTASLEQKEKPASPASFVLQVPKGRV